MQKQVKTTLEMVTAAVRSWDGIEAITYIPSEDDIFDPYFFIRFDVYTRNGIPPEETRLQAFHFAGGFESSPFHQKDRFLVNDLPVRVDYKTVGEIPASDNTDAVTRFLSREEGTYPMFRIAESHILYSNGDWFSRLQHSLSHINESVWNVLQDFFLLRMEHHLSDFGAAVYRNDPIFQKTALAGFIRGMASTLFAINRRFEPSSRGLHRQLYQLADLPEGFEGRFQVLLENDLSPEQQLEIADMITKGILHLTEARAIH
ncbi:hypothetical protein [Spirochaeta africana]|uniref:DUF4037 domain-containing protein n=1 Tax=Spirochaeta africana (strain ATCC 700263 / DSM 8902 / Z-7692) TaxID=889378 RepID=H9UIS7_SPIAZ|nr:hypothetical protein [Spirochaeta africana]AFG37420.1 hypothetical protein Spiaf_1353 [Spirochaeta africana DSM 8902]